MRGAINEKQIREIRGSYSLINPYPLFLAKNHYFIEIKINAMRPASFIKNKEPLDSKYQGALL